MPDSLYEMELGTTGKRFRGKNRSSWNSHGGQTQGMSQTNLQTTAPSKAIRRFAVRPRSEFLARNAHNEKTARDLTAISVRDDGHSINQLDRCPGRVQTRLMKNAATLLMAVLTLCGAVWAEDLEDRNRTTLVIVADPHVTAYLWPVLVESLRLESALESRQAPVDSDPSIILADRTTPGPEFPKRIQIQLLGRCDLGAPSFGSRGGPLGWVLEYQGKIEPNIRVNCARLTQYLRPVIALMPNERRQQAVSEAISRIVLHEWIHIATQSAQHHGRGIMQSELSMHDLIAPIPQKSAGTTQIAADRRGWGFRLHGKHAVLSSDLQRPELAGPYSH
jgi:hypothetical protein